MFDSVIMGVAVKSTVALAAAWLLSILLRRNTAAARNLVWTSALTAILALPLLSRLLPAVPVPADFTPRVVFRTSATPSAVAPAAAAAVRIHAPGVAGHSVDGGLWLLLVWAAGSAAGFAQISIAAGALWKLRRHARPLDCPELAGCRVAVLAGKPGTMPMACGVFRPAILMPADAALWPEERRRVVLLHEWAHVRRGDAAAHLLARFALAFYWWNPLAWVAWREFLKESERAADDLVLHAGVRPSDYAGHLLEIARGMQSVPAMGVAMARRSQLEGRVTAILDSSLRRAGAGRASFLMGALLAIFLVAPFAALRAQDSAQTVPADVDATIRAALAQKNHQMLESAATAAEAFHKFDLAQKLLESSLAIRAQVSGEQSAAYGLGLIKLGDLERNRRNFEQAATFYTQAAAVLGDKPEAAPALLHLGTLVMQKDPQQAFEYFQKAQTADPAHAGQALVWMAIVRDLQGNTAEAESLFKRALAPEDAHSPQAATTMELYAAFLARQNRAEEAASLRAQAGDLRKELGAHAGVVRQASIGTAVRVGGSVMPPRLLSKVEPKYTEEARLAKYQGTVLVSAEIGPDGAAQNMRVVRGLGLGLDEKALQAIAQWKFQPGTKDGQPVPVVAQIEVNFRLL